MKPPAPASDLVGEQVNAKAAENTVLCRFFVDSMETTMTVTYTLTREDILHYYRYLLAKTFKIPSAWAFAGGVVLFLIGSLAVVEISSQRIETVFTYNLLFCGLMFWGAMIAWSCSTPRLKGVIERQTQTTPSLFAKTSLTINPAWLVASSVYGDVRLHWQGVYQITSDMQSIYISVSGVALIIPKSSYGSAAEAQAFLNTATEYWQAAKQRPLEAEAGVWPPAPCVGA